MSEQGTGGTQDARTIVDLLTKPKEGITTSFELAEALDGKPGGRLIVERRKLQAETPTELPRAESKARDHTFFAAEGFISYLLKFGSDNTVIYCDPGERVVQAILDEKAATGREIVELRPQTHPRWQPWRSLLGVKMNLDAFRELVTQNRKTIHKPNGRELLFMLRQIRMSTEVVLQSGVVKGGAAAVNGLIIRTTISGGGKDSDTLELPESITVRTPILVDEQPQDVEMDLILGGKRDGTEVYCSLASADLKEAEIVAFDALVHRLRVELELGGQSGEHEDRAARFTVTHGRAGEVSWDRLRG